MAKTRKTNKRLPLSGTEPVLWLKDWLKPEVGNCYSKSLNDPLNRPGLEKAQPGDRAGLSHIPMNLTTCDISNRILADNPGHIYKVRAEMPCQKGFHKLFVFNDPVGKDFHLYRAVKDLVMEMPTGRSLASLAKEFQIPKSKVVLLADGQVLLRDLAIYVHKLGYAPGGALLKDSCGKLIKDPRKACRTYGTRTYSKPCGSFCARSGVARSRPDALYQ